MARSTSHRKKRVENDPSYVKKKPLEFFPVTRKSELQFLAAVPSAIGFGDAGAILSRLNNRLYRYGKLYDIKLDLSAASTPGTVFEVFALSNTWYVQKAFEEAYDNHEEAYADEMSNINKSQVARWRDFRIRVNANPSYGGVLGLSQWAYPVVHDVPNTPGAPGNAITAGDLPDSLVEDSAGNTKHFTWGPGSGATLYNVMQEYDLAGNQDRTPDVSTTDMPYEGLKADSSAVEANALQALGQDPPYGATAFPNVWVKVGELTVGTAGQTKLSTGFFHAPCGVFAIYSDAGDISGDAGDNISIEVRSGDYKGVRAHNMMRLVD